MISRKNKVVPIVKDEARVQKADTLEFELAGAAVLAASSVDESLNSLTSEKGSASSRLLERLRWSKAYQTHDAEVDRTHRHLLEVMYQLIGAASSDGTNASEMAHLIAETIGVFRLHLEAESALLKKADAAVDFIQGHREHHFEYLAKISAYERDLASGFSLPSATILSVLALEMIRHIEFEVCHLSATQG